MPDKRLGEVCSRTVDQMKKGEPGLSQRCFVFRQAQHSGDCAPIEKRTTHVLVAVPGLLQEHLFNGASFLGSRIGTNRIYFRRWRRLLRRRHRLLQNPRTLQRHHQHRQMWKCTMTCSKHCATQVTLVNRITSNECRSGVERGITTDDDKHHVCVCVRLRVADPTR